MPLNTYGRTVTQIAVAAGAAASTDLVAAPGAGLKIYVVGMVLVQKAVGTLKFTEGVGPTDLTGVIDEAAAGGFVVFDNGNVVLQTNTANSKLSIVTAGAGANANGWLRYFIDA